MARVFFRLGLIVAMAWGWSSHAQAQSVAAGPEECGKSPYVLVADDWSCEKRVLAAEMRALRFEERAIVAERADPAQARAETVEVKSRAARNRARGKAPTETGVSAETSRRLYELLLLDALRSAGRR
jgi:hypothetical protein